jgi:hypothetical protein
VEMLQSYVFSLSPFLLIFVIPHLLITAHVDFARRPPLISLIPTGL